MDAKMCHITSDLDKGTCTEKPPLQRHLNPIRSTNNDEDPSISPARDSLA